MNERVKCALRSRCLIHLRSLSVSLSLADPLPHTHASHLGLREEAPREECQLEGEVEGDPAEQHRQKRLQNAECRKHHPVRQPVRREERGRDKRERYSSKEHTAGRN